MDLLGPRTEREASNDCSPGHGPSRAERSGALVVHGEASVPAMEPEIFGPQRRGGRAPRLVDAQELWDIDDVATYLGVTKQTIYSWRTTGYGPTGFRRVPWSGSAWVSQSVLRRHIVTCARRARTQGSTTRVPARWGSRSVWSRRPWNCRRSRSRPISDSTPTRTSQRPRVPGVLQHRDASSLPSSSPSSRR